MVCAYHAVSGLAVIVVDGFIPFDLLSVERLTIFHLALEHGRAEEISRRHNLQAWQCRWDGKVGGMMVLIDIGPCASIDT